nr:putative reverse transcriptase domain-containing protein [Tanacetum cinerariifolium]
MVNVIPLDHVDEVPVVELNQHDDVPVVPEPVLVDEEEDPKEDEFKDEEEVDPFNPLPPASESEPDDEIEVENPIEHMDETVPASVHEVGESSATPFLQEDSDSLLLGLIRRKLTRYLVRWLLFQDDLRSSVEQGTAAMEKLVETLGNTKDKVECKKLKKELKDASFRNTVLPMQNQRIVFLIMPPKSTPMTQAAIPRMIKDNVDATIAAERARQANVKNDASGYGPVRGQDAAHVVRECTFIGFMKCNPVVFHGVEGAVKLRRWFKKTKSVFEISKCTEGKKVKFAAATLKGPSLTW